MQRKSRPARTRRPALRKTKPLMMKRKPLRKTKPLMMKKRNPPPRPNNYTLRKTTTKAPIKVKVPKNEMAYWTQKLKATPAKIHAAIKKAGTNKVAIVKKYL